MFIKADIIVKTDDNMFIKADIIVKTDADMFIDIY